MFLSVSTAAVYSDYIYLEMLLIRVRTVQFVYNNVQILCCTLFTVRLVF
jgi:hypothetical protein